MRGEIAVLRERLSSYEKMEEDMTMAVQAAISLESTCESGMVVVSVGYGEVGRHTGW